MGILAPSEAEELDAWIQFLEEISDSERLDFARQQRTEAETPTIQ
jgi:hypothetical protein